MSGPAFWTQPEFVGAKPVLDGQVLSCALPIDRRPKGRGAVVLEMADGSSVIQRPFRQESTAEEKTIWEWRMKVQADQESDVRLFERLARRGRSAYFVPYAVETEVWTVTAGETSFTLSRPTAVSVYTAFSTASYPARAWVDGVEQTVIASPARRHRAR